MILWIFKYGVIILIFSLGLLAFFSVKRYNHKNKSKGKDGNFKEGNESRIDLKKRNIIISLIYLLLGFGFLFKFLCYALIYVLDPIPDGFLFYIFNIEHLNLQPIEISSILYDYNDINSSLVNVLVLFSLISLIGILFSAWNLITNFFTGILKLSIRMLITGIIGCFLSGFTTSLYAFL
jgi:hypothetical protein